MTQQTFGQKAVGLSFNPSGDAAVHECKQRFADAIDQMNDLRNSTLSNGHAYAYRFHFDGKSYD